MRLFAGIALDDATRAACAHVAGRLEGSGFPGRYDSPDKYHVTLAFLGNVESARFERISCVLDEAARQTDAFMITLDKLGAFPHERRPRIVYIGSRNQGAAFRTLALALRERYEAMGFTFKDDAVAHVTVARVKGGSTKPLPLIDVEPIQSQAGEITLFESLPAETTTRYVVRHTSAMKS
jgi:RNA 2',3'-cyclic 3'-phosphodiesterase